MEPRRLVGALGALVIALAASLWLVPVGQAADDPTNASHRLAINFNEAMNRCLQSACSNIEDVIGFFADGGSYLDDAGQMWNGKVAIRRRLARTVADPSTLDRIEGIEVAGPIITLRLERRRVIKVEKYSITQVNAHVQVVLIKGGRITRLISVIAPDDK